MPNGKLKPNALSDQYQLYKQFLSTINEKKIFSSPQYQHLTIPLTESLGDGQEVRDMRSPVPGTEA